MSEYLLIMYNDTQDQNTVDNPDHWNSYLSSLLADGQIADVSAVSGGVRCNKNRADQHADTHIMGFIRVRADNLQAAKIWLIGNPVYEAGGTVEIRALLRD